MLALVINNKKYLTLNLSKGPKFIYTFHIKFYTKFKLPNIIGKAAQKLNFYYISMIPKPNIKF